ncbi:hypothetical protein [Aquimarina spinulae]|uniref:hypothetical protein n=1 Tax=Aquimarina spinulae TaxID=1192023 RepID=UPI000D54E561|nr:hypothetical protein [Aquimarina spinulae]
MKHFFVILFLLVIYSCNTSLPQIEVSTSEKKALDSIASIYGGNISYSKEVISIGTDKNSHFFQIGVDKSSALSDFSEYKYLPPSNIVLVFYSLISEKERKEYDKYKVSVNYSGDLKKYEYSREKLLTVMSCMEKTDFIRNLLKNKDYSVLKSVIDIHPLFNFDVDLLISGIKKIDEDYGEIKNSTITGFTFHTTNDNNFTFFKIYGFFEREKQNNLFSFFIDPRTKSVFKIEYEW